MIDDSDYERYYSDRCDSFVQDENNLDDNQLVPQLSDRDLPGARLSIIQFFAMNDRRLVCYGNTSWGTCAHTLYRRPHNDKIYAPESPRIIWPNTLNNKIIINNENKLITKY